MLKTLIKFLDNKSLNPRHLESLDPLLESIGEEPENKRSKQFRLFLFPDSIFIDNV
jgi:hypothetical protein